jgi:hypothetical protein
VAEWYAAGEYVLGDKGEQINGLLLVNGSSYRRAIVWAERTISFVQLGVAALGARIVRQYTLSQWILDAVKVDAAPPDVGGRTHDTIMVGSAHAYARVQECAQIACMLMDGTCARVWFDRHTDGVRDVRAPVEHSTCPVRRLL